MRHHNSYSDLDCRLRDGEKVMEPYSTQYIDAYNKTKFANASLKKRYVQIIKYVAEHDGCKRTDIIHDLFKMNVKAFDVVKYPDGHSIKRRMCRGQWSAGFSQLLYLDLIDYDKSYQYHVTDKGRKVLKTAIQNDVNDLMSMIR